MVHFPDPDLIPPRPAEARIRNQSMSEPYGLTDITTSLRYRSNSQVDILPRNSSCQVVHTVALYNKTENR
jgi:hypothetical protein